MTNMTQRIDAALSSALNEKRIVGAVIAVMKDGELAHFKPYGLANREQGKPMTEDAIFRLASISKPIVTAAAMRMIELGKFALDTPVTDFLPDFKPKAPDGSTPTITIRHLLTHTAGLSYDFLQPPEGPYNTIPVSAGIDGDFTMEDNLARMVKAGLTFPPGAMWLYSVAIDVLGAVMAKAEGTDVEGAVHKHVTGPLQMTDTSFYVTDEKRLVQPYSNAAPEPVPIGDNFKQPFVPGCAPINLGTSRAFNRNAFQGGGGCMNGKALDIVRLLDAIRAGGAPILSKESTQADDVQPGRPPPHPVRPHRQHRLRLRRLDPPRPRSLRLGPLARLLAMGRRLGSQLVRRPHAQADDRESHQHNARRHGRTIAGRCSARGGGGLRRGSPPSSFETAFGLLRMRASRHHER